MSEYIEIKIEVNADYVENYEVLKNLINCTHTVRIDSIEHMQSCISNTLNILKGMYD